MSQLGSFEETDALSLIRQLNETDEHSRCEAKTSQQLGRSLMETVCAFSNEPKLNGGFILLGVAPSEKTLFPAYEFVGIDNPSKLQDDIASACRTSFNRPIRPKLKVEVVRNHQAVVMFVPEAADADKPIYFNNDGLPRGAYRRTGSADQRCSEDDLILFYGQQATETYDRKIISDSSLEDIDPAAIKAYRAARRKMKADAEELSWSDKDLLLAISCLRAENNVLKPTVAGILLFGRKQAIRRLFPMTRIDYVRVNGVQWVQNLEDRFASISVRDPLITAIKRLSDVVLADIPQVFSLPPGALQREEETILPSRVIREVLVNAVMHRCYRVHGPSQIIRYNNRLEFRNPGHSLISEDNFGRAGSQTRNPIIAAVLYDIGFAENKGSGIRVMQGMMHNAKLPPPVFESDRESNQFIAYLMMHNLLTPENVEWLASFSSFELTGDEQTALLVARELGAIDNATYRSINGTDTLESSSHLRRLRNLGLLATRGKGNKTYYKLHESIGEKGFITGELESLKGVAGSAKQGVNGKTGELDEDFPFAPIPDEVQCRLPKLGGRADPSLVRTSILILCEWRPLMPTEIAAYINRKNVKNLVEQYIKPMFTEELLSRTIPDTPTHPGQRYIATAKGVQLLIG